MSDVSDKTIMPATRSHTDRLNETLATVQQAIAAIPEGVQVDPTLIYVLAGLVLATGNFSGGGGSGGGATPLEIQGAIESAANLENASTWLADIYNQSTNIGLVLTASEAIQSYLTSTLSSEIAAASKQGVEAAVNVDRIATLLNEVKGLTDVIAALCADGTLSPSEMAGAIKQGNESLKSFTSRLFTTSFNLSTSKPIAHLRVQYVSDDLPTNTLELKFGTSDPFAVLYPGDAVELPGIFQQAVLSGTLSVTAGAHKIVLALLSVEV